MFDTFHIDVDKESQLGFNTRQIHAGATPDPTTKARGVPIYATASYVFTSSSHARRVCNNEEDGYVYSRISNPTVEVLEKRVASLEGGSAVVGCLSGQSAIFQTILCLVGTGENIVSSTSLYGGTYSLFKSLLPRLGIMVQWVHDDDAECFRKLINDKPRLCYVETVGNPKISIPDLSGIAQIAHSYGIPLVVDKTFGAGGFWCPVIQHGADIVIHSATKWLGGHGTTLGGVVVDSGKFDWEASKDKYRVLTTKSEGPISASYSSAFGNFAFAMALRIEGVMKIGSVMNPFAAHQLLIGIETPSLRCERIASNAFQIATALAASPHIAWVSYPGLETDPYHSRANKYLRRGYGGVLSFGLQGGLKASESFIDSLTLVSNMTNIGDCKTMATRPWSSTHSIMSEEDRLNAGISEDLIRLSVGVEDIEDVLGQFEKAFQAIDGEEPRDGTKKV
ncbi:hypothetical protein VHEMI06872 [[Torrubiella] hemipterigena]|uniref:O-acetylhomoserine (Thiol)-lyase n=1 Tax=[Torrubiella] hemipterigena TaxID=1531966 RepID=A0A0A1T8M3_9HYPO|nr:hypothetical protein VHEMI06872 [[Torrubiella] hemipterigena]